MIEQKSRCLYFDAYNQQFAILETEQGGIHFVHWKELFNFGFRALNDITNKKEGELDQIYHCRYKVSDRGSCLEYITLSKESEFQSQYQVIQNLGTCNPITKLDWSKYLGSSSKPLVFINCTFEDIEFDYLEEQQSLNLSSIIFIQCSFNGNFRLMGCSITTDIWMPNCCFSKHFSLKKTCVKGDVHLEGCNFSGSGGASFRGIYAKNLYLDFGVVGSKDLFWLNEMTVSGVVSIVGTFESGVQLLGVQDESTTNNAKIGQLNLGVGVNGNDEAHNDTFSKRIVISDYQFDMGIVIQRFSTSEFLLSKSFLPRLECYKISVDRDLLIEECKIQDLNIIESSIGRHLRLAKNESVSELNLHGTSIAQNFFFETKAVKVNLSRFVASRVLFYPSNLLIGEKRKWWQYASLKPKAFDCLALKGASRIEHHDMLCSLKRWYADSGSLELEDVAYFHMRDVSEPNIIKRFLFGSVFGWGVRLQNIVLSSVMVLLSFALTFTVFSQMSVKQAITLSVQSFISSFFGTWPQVKPESSLGLLVTAESILGIVFITVLVGAYIRKLLR